MCRQFTIGNVDFLCGIFLFYLCMCYVSAHGTGALYTAVNHVNEQGILKQKSTQLMNKSCREVCTWPPTLKHKVQATTANTSSISLIHRDYTLHLPPLHLRFYHYRCCCRSSSFCVLRCTARSHRTNSDSDCCRIRKI